jgi:putative hydrolase of the HAD superfamily
MTVIENILECERYLDGADAVIFDLDDTLYPEKGYVRSGYASVAEAFPNIENMEERLWKAFEEKKPAIDLVLGEEGMGESERMRAVEIYRNHSPRIELYSGVEQLLLRLSETKRLGLITDGRPEGQRAKIDALDISGYFEKIIVTDELGGVQFRKPDKTAFVMMQKELDVPFCRMVYIGDNPKKDFKAPELLGMKAIHFLNRDGLYNNG